MERPHMEEIESDMKYSGAQNTVFCRLEIFMVEQAEYEVEWIWYVGKVDFEIGRPLGFT